MSSHISKHEEHSLRLFLLRTVSAQLHLFGLALAATFFLFLLWALQNSPSHSDPSHIAACLIFGVTSLLVFASSAVYHFIGDGYRLSDSANSFLKNVDHSAIYLFIAGSYTAFIVNKITAPWDLRILIAVWTAAIAGIMYTVAKNRLPARFQSRYVSTALFIALGWTLAIRLEEAWTALDPIGQFMLVMGGASYTLGAVVYAMKLPDPFPNRFGFHEIWHITVLMGYTFHAVMVLRFYL